MLSEENKFLFIVAELSAECNKNDRDFSGYRENKRTAFSRIPEKAAASTGVRHDQRCGSSSRSSSGEIPPFAFTSGKRSRRNRMKPINESE